MSKVLEHIIHEKVTNSTSDGISTLQFGYMKGQSTLYNNFFSSLKIFKSTKPIYLEFSKAFDRVPHNKLLLKLWQIGIAGDLWWWFKSYRCT